MGAATLVAAWVAHAGPAVAAGPVTEADCDHVIEPDQPSARGDQLGVVPGDVVCVRAGQRPFLRLYDFVGTDAEPITITNLGGQVQIDNDDRGYGLTGEGMAHVRVTGTGDASVQYGFSVRASREGPDYSASGVVFNGLSTNYELDHMEVFEIGFSGFNLKTEPRCDGSANLGAFTQYDTYVHDNYVHDTRGEGLYLGSTGYGGRDYQCDGQTTTLYPHDHVGFFVYDNIIENTGWDGAQVGITPMDCEIHHNVIRNVGLENEDVQSNGLQIGGASSCEVWANWIENGPTNGIIILDAADTYVHDNVIVGFQTHGIYVNDRNTAEVAGSSYVFAHNTIAEIGEDGIELYAAVTSGHVGKNNLIVDVGGTALAIGNGVDWTEDGNLEGDAANVGFVDAAARDFRLMEGSVAVDAGVDLSPYEAPTDILGVTRDANPDVGAYEWSDTPPPDDGGPGGGGTGGSGDSGDAGGSGDGADGGDGTGETGSGANGDEGGCACRATAPSGGAGSGAMGLLGLAVFAVPAVARRRRRRAPR